MSFIIEAIITYKSSEKIPLMISGIRGPFEKIEEKLSSIINMFLERPTMETMLIKKVPVNYMPLRFLDTPEQKTK